MPGTYLRDIALPALRAGAEHAGRPVPPLVAHAPVCVHDDADEVRAAVRERFGSYLRNDYFQRLFGDAGFPEGSRGIWSDAMIDAVVPWGSESRVAARLEELFSFGVTEIILSPVLAGDDREASLDRTLRLVAQVALQVAGD